MRPFALLSIALICAAYARPIAQNDDKDHFLDPTVTSTQETPQLRIIDQLLRQKIADDGNFAKSLVLTSSNVMVNTTSSQESSQTTAYQSQVLDHSNESKMDSPSDEDTPAKEHFADKYDSSAFENHKEPHPIQGSNATTTSSVSTVHMTETKETPLAHDAEEQSTFDQSEPAHVAKENAHKDKVKELGPSQDTSPTIQEFTPEGILDDGFDNQADQDLSEETPTNVVTTAQVTNENHEPTPFAITHPTGNPIEQSSPQPAPLPATQPTTSKDMTFPGPAPSAAPSSAQVTPENQIQPPPASSGAASPAPPTFSSGAVLPAANTNTRTTDAKTSTPSSDSDHPNSNENGSIPQPGLAQKPSSAHLSTGAASGIIIGTVAVVILVATLVARRRRLSQEESSAATVMEDVLESQKKPDETAPLSPPDLVTLELPVVASTAFTSQPQQKLETPIEEKDSWDMYVQSVQQSETTGIPQSLIEPLRLKSLRISGSEQSVTTTNNSPSDQVSASPVRTSYGSFKSFWAV